MEMVVRMEGMVETVLNRLVKKGYYKTKSEAVRAGIMELGKEYALVGEENYLVARKIRQMEREIETGKAKPYTLEEVARDIGVKL